MPIIKVTGLNCGGPQHDRLVNFLKRVTAGIVELGITVEQVTVHSLKTCEGEVPSCEDITIEVTIFRKPERTLEVRNRLAKALAGACATFLETVGFEGNPLIEVIIITIDPEADGFFARRLRP